MVFKANNNNWMAWALSLFIAICGFLAVMGIQQNNSRLEKVETKLDAINAKNVEQDICMNGVKKDYEQLIRMMETHINKQK